MNDSAAKTMTGRVECIKEVSMSYLKEVMQPGKTAASCWGHGQV